MKKLFLLTAITCCSLFSKAQVVYDFESWHNVLGTLTIPNGWNCTDSLLKYYGLLLNFGATFPAQAIKENPGNGGGFALKAITKTQPGLGTVLPAGPAPSLCSNAMIDINTTTGEFTFNGGLPFNSNPTSASMWIKNNPLGGDSTSITLLAIDDSDGGDSTAAVADTLLGATIGTWTKITLPFKYVGIGFNTTKLRVSVSSSGNFYFDTTGAFAGLTDGSWIAVDGIEITAPTGITNMLYPDKIADVYPTLVHDLLFVKQYAYTNTTNHLTITNTDGSKVFNSAMHSSTQSFDLSSLSKGLYFYTITKDNKVLQNGKINKE